jgi:hypothetical protein
MISGLNIARDQTAGNIWENVGKNHFFLRISENMEKLNNIEIIHF